MTFLVASYKILQGIGIFSLSKASKLQSTVLTVYRIFIFFITFIITILMTVQLFVAPDLSILAKTIDMWTMFFSGLYKWFYMTIFNNEFAKFKTNLVQIQDQGKAAYGSSANQFSTDYLRFSEKITFWYIGLGFVVISLLSFSPIISYPKGNRSNIDYYNDPKVYPLSCWIPFTIKETWMYLTLFILELTTLALVVNMYLGIDTYMFGAIYAIGGQIELLNLSLKKVGKIMSIENSTTVNQKLNNNEKYQKLYYSSLRDCTKHHILILDYIKNIRVMFSSLIIIDYIHGMISMTFILFQMTISVSIGESIGVIFFLIISLLHQFFNNFFGELIIQKQLSIQLAINHIPWWRADKKLRQLLVMMIRRSIHPNFITGFYLYKLCYASFISFLKALYTYYMVLRNVNEKIDLQG